MTPTDATQAPCLAQLAACFEGAVPAVIATAAGDGTPNVTYLSRVVMVDDAHVALSNQFFSKTSRNLAENPVASVLLIAPATYDEWRLTLRYRRTERRGATFERLRADVDALAALEGMEDVFRLRSADIYSVETIERIDRRSGDPDAPTSVAPIPALPAPDVDLRRTEALAGLVERLARSPDLDSLVSGTVDGVTEALGHGHCHLMLLDESATTLFTIASRGYDDEGVGSEVRVGEGLTGMAVARSTAIRIGNLDQMRKYSRRVRHSYEEHGTLAPGDEIPVPGLDGARSLLAVPAVAAGEVVGVLVVEDTGPAAFDGHDEAELSIVASVVGHAAELHRIRDLAAARADEAPGRVETTRQRPDGPHEGEPVLIRFYPGDGSTFVDGEYLIKGVAGRILWSLVVAHDADGRVDFTNRELRLDPSLELPAFKDNLESRLILLKRRLDEREMPVRIERTGRGRFVMSVGAPLRLEEMNVDRNR